MCAVPQGERWLQGRPVRASGGRAWPGITARPGEDAEHNSRPGPDERQAVAASPRQATTRGETAQETAVSGRALWKPVTRSLTNCFSGWFFFRDKSKPSKTEKYKGYLQRN